MKSMEYVKSAIDKSFSKFWPGMTDVCKVRAELDKNDLGGAIYEMFHQKSDSQ